MKALAGAAVDKLSATGTSPSLATVSEWVKKYWLLISTIIALTYVLSYFARRGSEPFGKAVRSVLVYSALALFIGVPVANEIWGEKPPVPSQQQPSTASSYGQQARLLPQDTPGIVWATPTNEGQRPRVEVPRNGDSIRVPNIVNGHTVWGGDGFTIHQVYGDGHECTFIAGTNNPCSGGTVESYIHNDGITTVYASYAYAR